MFFADVFILVKIERNVLNLKSTLIVAFIVDKDLFDCSLKTLIKKYLTESYNREIFDHKRDSFLLL